MSFGFVWVAHTSVAGRTIVESSGVNRFSCRSIRPIMYTLTRGSLSTRREHVPPAQMSRFQILDLAPISGSDSPEDRRNLSPSQKRKDGGASEGCCGAQTGIAAWQMEEGSGGLHHFRLFFSASPSLVAAEAVLTRAPIDGICLRHPEGIDSSDVLLHFVGVMPVSFYCGGRRYDGAVCKRGSGYNFWHEDQLNLSGDGDGEGFRHRTPCKV